MCHPCPLCSHLSLVLTLVPCAVLLAQTSLKCPYMNTTQATPPRWGLSEIHQSSPRPLFFAPPFQAPPPHCPAPLHLCSCPAPSLLTLPQSHAPWWWLHPSTWLWGPCTPRPGFPPPNPAGAPCPPPAPNHNHSGLERREAVYWGTGVAPQHTGGLPAAPKALRGGGVGAAAPPPPSQIIIIKNDFGPDKTGRGAAAWAGGHPAGPWRGLRQFGGGPWQAEAWGVRRGSEDLAGHPVSRHASL